MALMASKDYIGDRARDGVVSIYPSLNAQSQKGCEQQKWNKIKHVQCCRALLFLQPFLPSPRKALRQGLWDASRAGLLRPSSLQNMSNDAWWFLQQRVFLAAWKLSAQLEPISRNLYFLRNKAAAFQTSSPLSTSWAEHPNLKAVICLSPEENSGATEQPMRWSLFCSGELSLPPASATMQHRGNESRAWASYKFLSLEAVTDMINYFFF